MTLTTWQIEAIQHAAMTGGLHLDSIGKTDLAKMTEEEWMIFIETVCDSYENEMRRFRGGNEPPF